MVTRKYDGFMYMVKYILTVVYRYNYNNGTVLKKKLHGNSWLFTNKVYISKPTLREQAFTWKKR
jgi:hypothetical protein